MGDFYGRKITFINSAGRTSAIVAQIQKLRNISNNNNSQDASVKLKKTKGKKDVSKKPTIKHAKKLKKKKVITEKIRHSEHESKIEKVSSRRTSRNSHDIAMYSGAEIKIEGFDHAGP